MALAEADEVMIFSGCAVVDHENTSGFGSHGSPPLVAIYTGHSATEQTQNIAYSRDLGRTWTKYPGNPVIAIGSREHRDPKVVWHAPTRRWIMVTVLADKHQVRFYGSPDLIYWSISATSVRSAASAAFGNARICLRCRSKASRARASGRSKSMSVAASAHR